MTITQTETLHIDFPDISNAINLSYTIVGNDRTKTAIFKILEHRTEVSNAVIKWSNDVITDIKINFINNISAAYAKAIRNTILTICDEL